MSDPIPVGTIITIIGEPPAGEWKLCNGDSLSVSEYGELFDVLQYYNGGAGDAFLLPDYRGRFMRGTDGGSEFDEDAGKRGKPAEGGNQGNRIGSVQECATGRPKTPFTALIPHVPNDWWQNTDFWGSGEYSVYNTDWGTFPTNTEGGDNETRPVNIYADFYILAKP